MKKILFLLIIFIGFMNCSNDSNDNEPAETQNNNIYQKELIGNWKAVQYGSSYTPASGYVYSDVGSNNWYFQNNSDKTFKLQTKDNYFEGSYTYSEVATNTLASFLKTGNEYLEIHLLNIEGDIYTFHVQGSAGVNSFRFKAKKQ